MVDVYTVNYRARRQEVETEWETVKVETVNNTINHMVRCDLIIGDNNKCVLL